jgi:hypothetical protein
LADNGLANNGGAIGERDVQLTARSPNPTPQGAGRVIAGCKRWPFRGGTAAAFVVPHRQPKAYQPTA